MKNFKNKKVRRTQGVVLKRTQGVVLKFKKETKVFCRPTKKYECALVHVDREHCSRFGFGRNAGFVQKFPSFV